MSELTQLPFDFPGAVYRSPMPFGPYDLRQDLMDAYQKAEIDLVVMLSARGEDQRLTGRDLAALYRQAGMQTLHLPIADYTTPEHAALVSVLDRIQSAAQAGQNVVVHCSAGIGRTGVLLACLAKQALGLDGEEAIRWVRAVIPSAVETAAQRQFVGAFNRSQEGL